MPILLDKNFLKLKSYSFRIWFRLGVDFSESEGDPTLLDNFKTFSFNSEISNSSFLVSNSNCFFSFLYIILRKAFNSRSSVRLETNSSLDSSENTSSESDSDVDSDPSSTVAISAMFTCSPSESDSDSDESESSQVATRPFFF